MQTKTQSKWLRKTLGIVLSVVLLLAANLPLFGSISVPQVKAASNSCSAPAARPSGNARVGGVALNQAANFLAEMDDITGAYYDETQDRIVFVGKTNTALPEFDKDDLAVAIKAVMFNKVLPAVSIEDSTISGKMDVLFYGGIENTQFGSVLFDTDYKMKQYVMGFDESDAPISSSVTGYKSVIQRYLDKNPAPGLDNAGRQWIEPDQVDLKRDNSTDSFIFDNVSMRLSYEPLSVENDPLYDQASEEFASHHTSYYDDFANEIPEYKDAKQLAKIVGVIKWLSDNDIAGDFRWAHDYTPEKVSTPSQIDTLSTGGTYNGYSFTTSGGIQYYTPNDYSSSTQSAALKSSSEAVNAPKEDINWTFNSGGQDYEAVAVAADAFRSLGSYSTDATDMSFPTSGDQNLSFSRSYSSYSDGQNGIGRGWSFMPAHLYDNKPKANGILVASCDAGDTFVKRDGLAFEANGQRESFEYDDTNLVECKYLPEDTAYESEITPSAPSGIRTNYKVKTKDQTVYTFEDLVNIPIYTNYELRLVSIEDKNGNKINYNYVSSSSAKLSNISDENGHKIDVFYNSDNLISYIRDWENRTVNYTYSDQGELLTVTDPEGNPIIYDYDENFKLASITDRENKTVIENTYTPEAKLETQTDASGVTTDYEYDEALRKITAEDELGRTKQASYDTKARITEEKDAASESATFTYGTEYAPLTITDKNGNTTTYTYDAKGNIETITYPDTKVVEYTYNDKNKVTKIEDYRYGVSPKVTDFTYNGSGDLTEIDEDGKITTIGYNADGEKTSEENPREKTTIWTRDSFGNPLTEVNPTTNTKTFEYDNLGRLVEKIDASGKTETYTYDDNGNILTVTNPSGTTTNLYDKENRIKKITLPNTAETDFTYNDAGLLAGVEDALSNTTTYGYDDYRNLTSQLNPASKTTSHEYDNLNRRIESTTPTGKITEWEYDPNGNMTKRIDPTTADVNYEYDEFNRLKKVIYPNSDEINYTYDFRGNVTQMVDPVGTTTYTYDEFDRLLTATDPYGNVVTYTYDENNNITKVKYPDNKEVTYTYNDSDRLTEVSDWNSDDTTYSYFANGNLALKTLPNGIISSYEYDNTNRLESVTHTKDSTTLAKFMYERDSLGNITKATESGSFYPTPTPTSTPTPTPTPTPAPGKDLIISSITTTPATPSAGSSYTVNYTVKNIGTVGTGSVVPQFYFFYDPPHPPTMASSSGNISTNSINLAAGAETTLTKSHTWGTSGTHYIWIVADRSNVVAEVNEDNNITSQSVLVAPAATPTNTPTPTPTNSPTPTPTNAPTPTPGSGKDLTITEVSTIPSTVEEDEDFTLRVKVRNNGDTATGTTQWKLGYYYDRGSSPSLGSYDETKNYSTTIAAGATATIDLTGQEFNDDGAHNIWVAVDRTNTIAEYNESNNMYGPYNLNVIAMGPRYDRFALNPLSGGFINSLSSLFKPGKVDAQGGYSIYTSTFTYDPLSRVTKATYPDDKQFGYSYNNVDNRTQMVATISGSQSTTNYTYNDDSGMTAAGSTSFTFDNKGNQITRSNSSGSATRTFNFDNKLTQSSPSAGSVSTYIYDGNKNRIAKTVGGATTRFINDVSGSLPNVLAEATAGNALTNYYVYGKGLISQGGPTQGSRTYPLEDGLGNIRYVTSNTGTIVNTYDYDPYGGLRSSSGSGVNMLFQGQQKDDETSLYYLRARMYDTEAGRFISRDPVEGYLTLPQTQNPYSYSINNPVNMSDPSGENTYGACGNVNLGLGAYGSCSLCLVYNTDTRSAGVASTFGAGGTTGVATGVGVSLMGSTAKTIGQLEGIDAFAGGSAWLGSVEGSVSKNNPQVKSVSAGLSVGPDFSPPFVPAEFHGGGQKTETLNLFSF